MTTVPTTNAAICSQKLLASPALLLVCVFIRGHLPPVSLLVETYGARTRPSLRQKFR